MAPGIDTLSFLPQFPGLWVGRWQYSAAERASSCLGLMSPLPPPSQTITSMTSPSLSLAWTALPPSLLIRSMMITVTARMAQMSQVSLFSVHSFIHSRFSECLGNASSCGAVVTKTDRPSPALPRLPAEWGKAGIEVSGLVRRVIAAGGAQRAPPFPPLAQPGGSGSLH